MDPRDGWCLLGGGGDGGCSCVSDDGLGWQRRGVGSAMKRTKIYFVFFSRSFHAYANCVCMQGVYMVWNVGSFSIHLRLSSNAK